MQGKIDLALHRCETFENLFHIDIAPVRITLSMILHSKNFATIFISINILYSFYVADQDTARYSFCSAQEKMYQFSRTLHNRQLIQFARIPVEFVVCFIRYQNRVKVITFSIALISPYSWCSRDLRLQCLELHTACILSQYHWDKEFHFPGKFHFLVKTITDSVRLGVVYSNIELRTANGVMLCEINLQSATHIATIHNPRPMISFQLL